MTLSPRFRKLSLTAHIASSVGWLGAVAVFLALAIIGLTNRNAQQMRVVYQAMELTTWVVIVPLAFASLLTGILSSLGTTWGLFRHYWVLTKLIVTILATGLLLIHTRPIGILADAAREATLSSADFGSLQIQIVADATIALLALTTTVALSVFKPWARTPYGRRRHQARRIPTLVDLPSRPPTEVAVPDAAVRRRPRWMLIAGVHAVILLLVMVVVHLAGGGMGGH